MHAVVVAYRGRSFVSIAMSPLWTNIQYIVIFINIIRAGVIHPTVEREYIKITPAAYNMQMITRRGALGRREVYNTILVKHTIRRLAFYTQTFRGHQSREK